MVVPPCLELFPLDLFEPRIGQRTEQRQLLGLESLPPGRVVGPTQVVVDLVDALLDRVVELGQARPDLVFEVADDTLVDHVDGVLGRGLIAGLARPGRDDRGPVMVGELLIAGVDNPLPVTLAPRMRRRRRVVRDHQLDHAPVERERAHVRVQPRRRLHVRVGAAEQHPRVGKHPDPQVRLGDLPGDRVDEIERVTGPIDEHRPSRLVVEHGDQVMRSDVVGEQGAELRIPVLLLPAALGVGVAAPCLQQREVPVLLHRRQHARQVRLRVLHRDPPASVREPRRELGITDRRSRGHSVPGEGLLHTRDVASRASDGLDDLAVTAICEHQLHDRPIVDHTKGLSDSVTGDTDVPPHRSEDHRNHGSTTYPEN